MMKIIRLFSLVVMLLAFASAAIQRASSPPIMPDPTKTPGDVLEVMKADICVPGYSRKVRDVRLGHEQGKSWEEIVVNAQ